jgi:flagellar biosynthetic protein FliP
LIYFITLLLFSSTAFGQTMNIDLGAGGSTTAKLFQLVAIIAFLGIAPSLLIMTTSFTRISVVLSFLRTGLGLQQSPPNVVLIGLSLFLTFFIMEPVFQTAYTNGIKPLMEEKIDEMKALERAAQPFKEFMLKSTREKDLGLFLDLSKVEKPKTPQETPFRVVVPAFMISELKRAFEIGFLLFIPFLVIDIVVSSVLMSLGMMMLPPVMISLPFKIIFFVLIDGWHMIVGSLVKSYPGAG